MSNKYYYRTGDDSLSGPFNSVTEIRKQILAHSKECFDSACNCLKKDPDTNWFETTEVFERILVVRPIVKAKIKLEEVQR